jgi:hypothetical protein
MSNSNIEVKQVTIDGYTQFVTTAKLVCGTIIRIASHSEDAAIAEAEEEIRYQSASSYNPNQGVNFDEDEDDYYS